MTGNQGRTGGRTDQETPHSPTGPGLAPIANRAIVHYNKEQLGALGMHEQHITCCRCHQNLGAEDVVGWRTKESCTHLRDELALGYPSCCVSQSDAYTGRYGGPAGHAPGAGAPQGTSDTTPGMMGVLRGAHAAGLEAGRARREYGQSYPTAGDIAQPFHRAASNEEAVGTRLGPGRRRPRADSDETRAAMETMSLQRRQDLSQSRVEFMPQRRLPQPGVPSYRNMMSRVGGDQDPSGSAQGAQQVGQALSSYKVGESSDSNRSEKSKGKQKEVYYGNLSP